MLQNRDFLPFQCGRVQSPDDALALGLISGHGIIDRNPPPGSDVIELAIAGEYEPAAMVDESVFRDARVAPLRGGSQIFDARPLALAGPDAHQTRVGDPGDCIDALTVGCGGNIVKDTVPACLEFQVVRQYEGGPFESIFFRVVPNEMPVIVSDPDAVLSIEKQGLSIDRSNAADIAPCSRLGVVDNEVIARVT